MDNAYDNNKKRKGIKLRIVNYIMLAVTMIVSVLLLAANYNSTKAYEKLRTIANDYIEWHKSATAMQTASDDLTEYARVYAVTGDMKFFDKYFKEALEDRNRENALATIKAKTFGTEAYDKLAAAYAESIRLMDTEYKSMKLRIIGDYYKDRTDAIEVASVDLEELGRNLGREYPKKVVDIEVSEFGSLTPDEMRETAWTIVFNEDYEDEKLIISGNVRGCLEEMDKDYIDQQMKAADSLSFLFRYEQVLVIAYVIVVVMLIALISYNLLIPLIKAIPYLKAEKKIPVRGAYEYRYLADTYNRMHELNEQHKQKLVKEATHDALTGVYNRREFRQILDKNENGPVALVLIDIDHFKQINDANGHDVGDKVLTAVSRKIEEIFAGHGYTCRIGGDEIAVIVTDIALSKDDIYEKTASINAEISAISDIPETTVSAGIAFYKKNMATASLFKYADRALYTTKQNGRKGVTIYKSDN